MRSDTLRRIVIGGSLDGMYVVIYFLAWILSLLFPKYWCDTVHAFTRNFWGAIVPNLDGRRVVWIHAVSVGEVFVCQQLIRRLQAIRQDLQFVLSVGTANGLTLALRELPEVASFPAPFDFTWAIRRTFDRLQPVALIIAENDFFPNQLFEAASRNIPLAIINTRMSPREQQEHAWNAWLLRPGLSRARWWGAVSEVDAEWIRRFFHVSPDRLEVTGSLKFDGMVRHADHNPKIFDIRSRLGLQDSERVLMAGSTHLGEEEILIVIAKRLIVDFPLLRLVIVPRQISRCIDVANLCQKHGLPFQICDPCDVNVSPQTCPLVTILNSIGILREAWGIAEIAFVGGSLVPIGGQNMLEPASYGKPACFGPHVWNFRSVADELLEANAAAQVRSVEELESTLREWLERPALASAIGRQAQQLVSARTEPLDRTVSGISALLGVAVPIELEAADVDAASREHMERQPSSVEVR